MTQLYYIGSSHPYRDRRRNGVVARFNAGQDEQIGKSEYNRLALLVEYESWTSWREGTQDSHKKTFSIVCRSSTSIITVNTISPCIIDDSST
jgi:hypothetical protein